MSTKKRRERDRMKMRRRILDAARHLFVKEGFDNVSMRRIAGAIEYSPAALYRYFKNKREILSELRNEAFSHYLVAQKKRSGTYTDPHERLLEGGKGYIRFALDEPDHFQLMFGTSCDQVELEGELASSAMESFFHFRDSVEKCVSEGCLGDVDLETAVFALWSNVHGLALLILSGQIETLSDRDLDDLIDSVLRFHLRNGIKK